MPAAHIPGGRIGRPHYAWIVLGTGVLVVFGALGLGRFAYGAVLPSMQAGLGLSNAEAGGIATVSLFGYLLLATAGGALASRFGPRAVVSLALLGVGVGMLLTGASRGFLTASSASLLTGMGSGAANVAVMGLLSAWFGPRRRGLASGIAVSGSSLALIGVGPLVPHLVGSDSAGWRACWLLFGLATIGLSTLAFGLLRNRPSDMGLNPLGAESAGGPLRERSHPGEQGPGSRAARGLHWHRVYRSAPVWHLGLVYIAFGFSYIIFMTFFTKRLIADGGYSPKAAGDLFMALGWFSLACGIVWGTVSDVVGRRTALVMVYSIHAMAFTIFAVWATPTGFTVATVLFGLTAWSIPAIMSAACGNLLGPRLAPAGLGFITLFFSVGQAVGPLVAGALADAAGDFVPAFLAAAVIAAAGAVGSSLLRPALLPEELTPLGDAQPALQRAGETE